MVTSSTKQQSKADADTGCKHVTDPDPADAPEPKRSKAAGEGQEQQTIEEAMGLKDVKEQKGSREAASPRDEGEKPVVSTEPPPESLRSGETAVEANGRGGSTPSSILEKGIIYFFFRGRVNVQKPEEVSDIARSYIILRPVENDAKLGTGPIGDAGNSRLCAIPKKKLPQNGQDRWMAFVEMAGASFPQLKEEFLSSSEYQTQTAGERHTPAATPVGEGVYAITTTGRESHLVYMITIPEKLGEVQMEIGLKEKGSFVLSTKNPEAEAPPGTSLPKGAEYPSKIMEEFRSLRWLPTQPKHLDYAYAQFLLIAIEQTREWEQYSPYLWDDHFSQADSDAISDQGSHSSLVRLDVVARVPGDATPGQRTPSRSPHSFGGDEYDPYGDYSTHRLPNLGMVDPNEIDDDGDDGINYGRRGPSTSVLSLGGSSRNGGEGANVASGATAGTIMGSLTGRNSNGDGGHYAPVNSASTAYSGAGANGSALKSGTSAAGGEKSQRKSSSGARWRKFRLLILLVIGLLVVVGAAVGVTVGIESRVKSEKSASSTSSSSSNTAGDLDINSPEIQSLMNNANLHKVFPGINYTPVNTQYPDCLTNPPSQNNITKDMAVLSQLTNTIRLYGTDCKQTEMVLHALVHLKLDSTVKVWLGVWQDGNETTNARQLAQTWDILDKKQMSTSQLGNLLDEASDLILANIHPFVGGVNAKDAASWTYSFWETHDAGFFKSDNSRNIISETGWPSQGGTYCGSSAVTDCPDAAVAGIDQMNQFMSDWVCQALANGTQYFWFEAFDEPWKLQTDGGSQDWEEHWGLMDVDRNLKSGVKIPTCGGKTVG
ncbi:hypothetical protein P8C59_009266 [Phyllachora maydis]|uniref:glucan endo-1,3-beta-D-glucosidase n=1 Tax=Phyllachora maydis TaxID=1825666 RepID=A0AAD9IC97_9PEZI|nr:hypothetical protein P8C59_009266 [Phyllachora maydis]